MKNSQLPGALGALFAVAWLSCTSASANPPMPLLITLRPAVQPLLQIKDKGREEEDNRKKKNQAKKERAGREEGKREQGEKDRAAREEAKRKQAERQKEVQEEQERKKAAREEGKREQGEKDRAAREEAKRKQAERQKEVQEEQERKKATREDAERRQAERQRAAQEEEQRKKAAREEAKREHGERERAAREEANERRVDRERAIRNARRLEEVKRNRKQRVEQGGTRVVIEEPDDRVIVKEHDRTFIRHDERERFRREAREVREQRRGDGTRELVFVRPDGAEIVTEYDSHDRLLRRARRESGREYVIIDNRRYYQENRYYDGGWPSPVDFTVVLPPPVVQIPREEYVVNYDAASDEELYETLTAPPVEQLDRGYALEQIQQSYSLRERMRSIELDAINFEFGSWDVAPEYYPLLQRLADAIKRVLATHPDEAFLIEGHTDAVGSEIDNLSLSDRRAEAVAIILTDSFGIPAENLVTQGYGEQFLRVQTELASRENRRVAIRRITPLLAKNPAASELDAQDLLAVCCRDRSRPQRRTLVPKRAWAIK
jgi:outer membrane protein OmpA-like peptidoglycan-associated protein